VSPVKRIVRHKLVSFGGNSTKTYTIEDAVSGVKVNKDGTDESVTMTRKELGEGEDAVVLDADTDPVGTYVFIQDATGVYINYVGYSVPFSIRLR